MKSSSLRNNVLYNFLGSVIPIAVTIATVPAYIHVIGEARYGVLALLWTIFGYFGLFDFGLSRATAHRLATLRSAPLREGVTVFYTACALNLVCGLVACVLLYLSGYPILSRFLVHHGDLRSEVLEALPLIVAFFPLSLLGGVLVGCMEANERFLQLNVQQAVGTVLQQSLPLALAYLVAPTLQMGVLGVIVARGLSIIWLGVSCLRWAWPAGRPEVDARHVKDLLRYGGWTTISNMFSPILTSIDQFVIGALLGPRAVAHYSVPYSMATKALVPPAAFTRALFPRLARYGAAEAEDLSRKALLILSGVMAAVCAPGILLSHLALQLWVGADFAAASHLTAKLLLIGVWINGVTFIPFTLLQARNKPEIIAKLHAVELVPFVLLLWLAVHFFGLPGAAAAWALRVTADGALMFWATGLRSRVLTDLLAPGSALLLALFISQWAHPGPAGALAWSAAVSVIPLAWMFARRGDMGMIAPKAAKAYSTEALK